MDTPVRILYLMLFLGISSMVTAAAVVSTGAIDSDSIVDTQDKLLKAQIEIIRINSGSITVDSLDELKQRLSTLEVEFKKLNELYQIHHKHANGSCEVALKMLMNHYNSIDSQLKDLQAKLEERALEADKKGSLMDIVQNIRRRQYKMAEEKLIQMGEMAQIPSIVHEVYADSDNNFDILIDLAKALSKISPSFQVLKSLNDEMTRNAHQDPNKLIILATTIESEVMKQHNDPNDIKSDAAALVEELIKTITTTSKGYFVKALKSGDYEKNANLHTLAGALYEFRPDVSDEVMQYLVEATYGVVEPKVILFGIISHSNTAQAISGINALFWKIKEAGNLNSSLTLELASSLSRLQKRTEFDSLSQVRKDAVDKVVENIPLCARNLFFKSAVCLWNKGRNTYLLASNASLLHDTQRRNIFTKKVAVNETSSDEVPPGASWIVDKVNESILFKSIKYTSEFLYAAAVNYSPTAHYVFSWIPGHNTDIQSEWNVELDGDYCHLKSVYFDEYLFASREGHPGNGNYSYVFTWRPGGLEDNADFVWQIRSC